MAGLKQRLAEATAATFETVTGLVGTNFRKHVVELLWDSHRFKIEGKELELEIYCPDLCAADKRDEEIVARVLKAFKKAKADQNAKAGVFLPSSLWQEQLKSAYAGLFSDNDAHFFLQNFGGWPVYTGIEHGALIRECSASAIGRRRLLSMMLPQLAWWRATEGLQCPLSALSYPLCGNQLGVLADGTFVGVGSVFNHIYGRQISNLAGKKRPIIAEIGGGYGKLFYFIQKNLEDYCYLDFDLPEVLCCAAYYLIKALPGKRVLLYGEADLDDVRLSDYDIVLMPSFEIGKLRDRSVDVFINATSLGEMRPETAGHFVREICRTAEFFWHMNHEREMNVFAGQEKSLVNAAYPVSDAFRLLLRYPDVGHLTHKGGFDTSSDIYFYIYQRRH
jgi:hypothetical protein